MLPLGFHPARQPNRRANLLCHVGRRSGAKNKCARVIDQILLHLATRTNECPRAPQSLAAGVNNGQQFTGDAGVSRQPAPFRPENTHRVRFVDDQLRAILARQRG